MKKRIKQKPTQNMSSLLFNKMTNQKQQQQQQLQ